MEVAKSSLKVWAGRAFLTRKLTPAGLLSSVAMGAAIEVGKISAGKFSDVVDKRLQKEFEERTNTQSKTLLVLFTRDLIMGVFPLVVLAFVPWLLEIKRHLHALPTRGRTEAPPCHCSF